MRKSETIGEIAKALAAAQAKMPTVTKDHTATVPMKSGGKFTYNYASLADTMQAVLPILSEHGIAVIQSPGGDIHNQCLTTLLLHESGEWIEDDMPLFIPKNDAQGQGSAITYARRYTFSALVGVAPDEDDDGNAATDHRPTRSDDMPATRSTGTQPGSRAAKDAAATGAPATENQWRLINDLTAHLGEELPADDITVPAASELINRLLDKKKGMAA